MSSVTSPGGRPARAAAANGHSTLAHKRKREGDGDGDLSMQNDDEDDELSELSESENEQLVDDEIESSEEEDDEEDDDDDADVYVEKKSRKRSARPRKPAQKRARTGLSSLPSRPKKSARSAVTATIEEFKAQEGTLFYDIFESDLSVSTVAEQWLIKYREQGDTAKTELINFVLQCAGCNIGITEIDIGDEENCQNRLIDIQSQHQDKAIIDYPLIAKGRGGGKPFRDLLSGFFDSLINLLHETDTLYEDHDLINTLYTWIATLSSSTLRPFRHTATAVTLMIQTGLVSVADILEKRIATLIVQRDTAESRRNTTKLNEVQISLADANNHKAICHDKIAAFFETVFVHRYRDVDAKIRTECVMALGSWVWDLPSVYLQPEYLRYLGWMLSDVTHATRLEVLKQLGRIFRRDTQKVGHFIERFRQRIVEIATSDSEVAVRVAAVGVIDGLRAAGMLEPSDIDEVGKMIFDAEARVRKAVVPFFVACVSEANEATVERVGGADAIDEVFASVEEDDYDSPQESWITIKNLAELLTIYNESLRDSTDNLVVKRPVADTLNKYDDPDTRLALVAQALFDKVNVVQDWEMVAGYLLYDHSTSTKTKRSKNNSSLEEVVKGLVAPKQEEELVLLEIMAASAKLSLGQNSLPVVQGKKLSRADMNELHENTSIKLANVMRKLLNKYGGDSATATSVLKLEHFLDLEIFSNLRQESNDYEKLLDEICTQFNRHNNRDVLLEAIACFLHARTYDDLEEMVEQRIANLWEEVIDSLRSFDKNYDLSVRGNLAEPQLAELGTILLKVSLLAKTADCCSFLEAPGRDVDSLEPAIVTIVDIVHRGEYSEPDPRVDDTEDEVVSLAIESALFYSMWKIRSMQASIQSGAGVTEKVIEFVSSLRQKLVTHMVETFTTRALSDDLQMLAAGTVCDIHVLLGSLRPFIQQAHAAGSVPNIDLVESLVRPVEPGLIGEFIFVLDGAEKVYAKWSKKTLNSPGEDEAPAPFDDDEDDDDEEDQSLSKIERTALELQAEKNLCDLAGKYVLAISSKLLDHVGNAPGTLQKRLQRNQHVLGPNYKELISYLDEAKIAEAINGRRKAPKKATGSKVAGAGIRAGPGGSTAGKKQHKSATNVDDSDSDLSEVDDIEESAEEFRRMELEEDGEEEPENDDRPPADDESILGD